MIRRPPRSTQGVSSAASDVYKRQGINAEYMGADIALGLGDVQVATLAMHQALISNLSGGLLGQQNLQMSIDFIFKYTSVNANYWGNAEEELASLGWLLSFVGSDLEQEYATEPNYDGGIGVPGNDRIIRWDVTGGQVEFKAIPEPSTMILLGLGLIGLAGIGKKKKKKKKKSTLR
eukprot:TRINITY_DN37254_c0_g1_i1.p1 TRINITY_DN37254_c0_g1~~TRINITY_DN37254_c0_g1_i1.p1  ORF type:complete len:176 (-),score=49.35 TRINITY_DN37254_c0_g1_i1:4-531(-)